MQLLYSNASVGILHYVYLSHTDPCSLVFCAPGYECQVYEETGEAFCSPNCEDLDPCGPQEICVITSVNCIRSPCPGVLSCEEGNHLKGIGVAPIPHCWLYQ